MHAFPATEDLQFLVGAVGVEPLCLSLNLDNGAVLRIYSELGPYECRQIYTAQGFIVF
jgi:hypothetical protein